MKKLMIIFGFYGLSVVSLLLFLSGYLSTNKILRHYDLSKNTDKLLINVTIYNKSEIDRLIFIVIDALREDFFSSKTMNHLYKHHTCKTQVKVESPTVTLPRIKALITGDVPQFLDIILNLGSATRCEDSFLHQVQKTGRKIIFYGDDTWLKIFPNMFLRFEGTDSFYVYDFYEVDNNITQNLAKELNNDDWDIMILHYLGTLKYSLLNKSHLKEYEISKRISLVGLDHIGHVYGPFSNLIGTKLSEMDRIIQMIHEKSKEWTKNTLIFVTGDHGMRDSGGHGGTTYGETHVPLIVIGKTSCDLKMNTVVAQSDVANTLSILFGVGISSGSIGQPIYQLLSTLSVEKLLFAYRYNLLNLKSKLDMCNQKFLHATRMHYDFLKFANASSSEVLNIYKDCMKLISQSILKQSRQENMTVTLFAILALANIFVLVLKAYVKLSDVVFCLIVFMCILMFYCELSVVILTCFVFIFLLKNILQCCFLHKKLFSCDNIYIVVGPLLHFLLLTSSSYIEEEHQILFYFITTCFILLFYDNFTKCKIVNSCELIIIILILRFCRRLNSVGDQWGGYPDFSDYLMLESNFCKLQLFYIFSFCTVFIAFRYYLNYNGGFTLISIFSVIFLYKMYFINSLFLGRFLWFSVILFLCCNYLSKRKISDNLIDTWCLVLCLLLKPYNICLISICIFGCYILQKYIKATIILTLCQYWFGCALFFYQGHSNSLASIDLSSSYIGLKEYQPLFVFLFTTLHVYAFPILTLLLLFRRRKESISIWTTLILCRLANTIMICIINYALRNHYFIWSVFAPKLLIESSHTTAFFLLMCFYVIYETIVIKLK